MRHVLLDVDVVVDLCVSGADSDASVQAVAVAEQAGASVWLYTGSVQGLETATANALRALQAAAGVAATDAGIQGRARELLRARTASYRWLSALAGEGDVFAADDPAAEQLLRALDRFESGAARLLTRDPKLLAAHPDKTLAPGQCTADAFSQAPLGFIDLATQQDLIRPALELNLHRVLQHGRYVMGPEVGELETRLAEYVGVRHCIGVSSGTDALLVALMALDVGPGAEVITTPFTFVATAEAIALLGAVPVFVDIDPLTYNIDPALIEAAITERTRAIMPVSLYGQCADMDAINAIAARHGLPVIEDAAQSFGATYKGRRSCGLSTIGCTSFFPSKPLGGYGDGGACFTDDADLALRMRQVMNHGQDRRYSHARLGINGRLDALQAAVLLAKLDIFDEEVPRRAEVGAAYSAALIARGASVVGSADAGLLVPHVAGHNTSVFAQYTIQVDDRAAIQQRLSEQGIPTAVHYPIPLNQQPAYRHLCCPDCTPLAAAAAERVMSLPMHPYLAVDRIERIADVLLPG